ncbi:MAG: peptidoglycan-binding protein [Clostridia bacterium]|nr:peptidoglycan-binding protein [Clostridia bacterium]
MKKLLAVLTALGMAICMTACNLILKNNEQQYDYPVTVGNLVLEEPAENIAVLSGNIADILIACGYEGKLSARSDECVQGALSILPSLGTPDSPDFNDLRELDIDLILTDKCFDDETAERLDKLGVNYLVMKSAADLDALGKLYSNAAAAVSGGYTGKMQAITSFEKVRSALEAIRVNFADEDIVTTACYIYDMREDECTVAYGSDFADKLFEYAALTNIAGGDDDGVIGIDTLLKGNPSAIFCDSGVYEKLKANNDLRSLKALSSGNVYELPSKYFEMQGMTCVVTTDFLAAKTHKDYVQTQQWPDELETKKSEEKVQEEYVPPFEPQEGIYYTIGESYAPIEAIEQRLIALGYFAGDADTEFTEETAAAVTLFQEQNGIEPSGVADYDTLKVLLSADAKAANYN